MSKKKKKSDPVLPTDGLVLACDALVFDPNSGKPNLFGVFERFNPPQLPHTGRFSVYCKLCGGSGEFPISIQVIGPDGKLVDGGKMDFDEVVASAGESVALGVGFGGVQLKKAGVYKLVVKSGRKKLAESLPISLQLAGGKGK